MTLHFSSLLVAATLSTMPLLAQSDSDTSSLMRRIVEQQEALAKDVAKLRAVLNVSPEEIETLKPQALGLDAKEAPKKFVEEGIRYFEKGKFEEAKEKFQLAWEDNPADPIINVNLALTYKKLGKELLCQKMLKSALESKTPFPDSAKVQAYLDKGVTPATGDSASPDDAAVTSMINFKKEADSYLSSKTLSWPKRMASTVRVLETMEKTAEGKEKIIKDYFLDIADTYSSFELYDKAMAVINRYETAMNGQVLPDGFYNRLLALKEKKKVFDETAAKYSGNTPDKTIGNKLGRDLKELSIFASQIEQFVHTPESEDPDFAKITKRLREYRWGDKAGRHVIVVSRYQELLYSTLEGTLPLDRYQDTVGSKFLKNITLLADRLTPKQTEFFETEITVNGTVVPYVILYSYVPKHDLFIIVRLPKRDLG